MRNAQPRAALASTAPADWMRPVDLLALARREPLPPAFDAHAVIKAAEYEAGHGTGIHHLFKTAKTRRLLEAKRTQIAARSLDELAAFDAALAERGYRLRTH